MLLVAGSRMGNLDVPFDAYWGDPEGKQLIQIDIDPRHFGVTRPLGLGIVADARAALEGIAQRLRARALPTARRSGARRAIARLTSRRGRRSRPDPANGRARASIPPTRSARSAPSSAPTPSTRSTAATPRCGHTTCCRRPARAPTTRSSSWGCSEPASRPRSAPSSERPSARSYASPATAPRAST